MRARGFYVPALALLMIAATLAVLLGIVSRWTALAPWIKVREVWVKLEWLDHHLRGPWNPFAKKTSNCVPYAAVRWQDSTPEVEVMRTWYELIALEDVRVTEIVSFCKKSRGRMWRKPFEEDLVIVLEEMGKQGYSDSETGSLTVRSLDTGEVIVLTNVAWTNANRQAILVMALAASKANGGKDPRVDPNYR